jgi:hypothetical protein
VKDIVALQGTRRGTSKHVLAGLAVVAVLGIAAVVAGWGIAPVRSVEISPADVVALRFPADWMDDATSTATAEAETEAPVQAASFSLASAESKPVAAVLFNPRPTYAVPPEAPAAQAPMSAPMSPPRVAPVAAAPQPERKVAALVPAAKSETKPEAKPEPTKVAATRSLAPEKHAAPKAKKDSGTLFNDAQLASIKTRLHLSEYQEQYWPPVAAALRDIGWRASHDVVRSSYAPSGSKLADIDPDSPEVDRLKSAAFPLIMSMNEDQKREVRMLAQVMGLERVAASF